MSSGYPPPIPPSGGGSSRRSRRNPIRNPFRPTPPPPASPVEPLQNLGVATEPLVAPEPPPPPSPPPGDGSEQRPRGFRRRRTTLPRSTRGWSRGIVWTLIGLTTFGALYGTFARIDSSVSATGKLRASGGITDVTAPFNAVVDKVLVREGAMVKVGQPLLQLRDQAVQKQIANVERMRAIWTKEVLVTAFQLGLPVPMPRDPALRRELEVEQREMLLREQSARAERARSVINLRQQLTDLASMRRRYALNAQIQRRMETLVSQGAMSRLELDRQIERQEELAAAILRTEQEVESAKRRIEEGGYKQRQIPAAERKQLYAQYDNARQQLLESEGRLMDLRERFELGRLRAPAAGRIFDLNIKPGEVITTAAPALRIVPQKGLEAELVVFNRDIGFIKLGQPVEVRIDSFPFTDYGALKGTLVRIAADAMPPDALHPQPYFPVIVRLPSNQQLSRNGKVYNLRAGMSVTSLINLGQRPVLSLILDRIGSFLESTEAIR